MGGGRLVWMLVVGGESVPVRFFWSWDSALSELSAAVKFLFFRFFLETAT